MYDLPLIAKAISFMHARFPSKRHKVKGNKEWALQYVVRAYQGQCDKTLSQLHSFPERAHV